VSAYEKVVQSAAEKLMEDEQLRSNLTDDEANILVNWAIEWLEGRVTKARDEAAARQMALAEAARLRVVMQKINGLLAEDKTPTVALALKTLGLGPATATSTSLDRKALVRSLTAQLTRAWGKQ